MSDYQSYEFLGWVDKVTVGKYGVDVIVRNFENAESSRAPQRVKFEASTKKAEISLVASKLKKNDKVAIKFTPWLLTGTSQSSGKPYEIMKLNVVDISVLQVGVQQKSEDEPTDAEPDLPF